VPASHSIGAQHPMCRPEGLSRVLGFKQVELRTKFSSGTEMYCCQVPVPHLGLTTRWPGRKAPADGYKVSAGRGMRLPKSRPPPALQCKTSQHWHGAAWRDAHGQVPVRHEWEISDSAASWPGGRLCAADASIQAPCHLHRCGTGISI